MFLEIYKLNNGKSVILQDGNLFGVIRNVIAEDNISDYVQLITAGAHHMYINMFPFYFAFAMSK